MEFIFILDVNNITWIMSDRATLFIGHVYLNQVKKRGQIYKELISYYISFEVNFLKYAIDSFVSNCRLLNRERKKREKKLWKPREG